MAVGDIVPVPGVPFEEALASASPDLLREMIRGFGDCLDVIRVAVAASPWGLADTGFAPFAAAYPGSSAAAVAAYWAERAESMLSFEKAHAAACRRVRYEDLTGHYEKEAQDIFAFLNLAPDGAVHSGMPAAMDAASDGHGGFLADAAIPFGYLSPPLTERVNNLQARLGYPPIG